MRLSPMEMLKKARIKVMKNNPCFGYLLMYLDFIEDKDIATIGVDSNGNCHYNPDFVSSHENELPFILVHEVLHLALQHPKRGKGRNKVILGITPDGKVMPYRLFNIASDYAINLMLKKHLEELDIDTLPNNILIDGRFEGKSAEEIYDILDKEYTENDKFAIPRIGIHLWENDTKNDISEDMKGSIKEDTKSEKKDWGVILQEAKVFGSKYKGNVPNGMLRDIEELMRPKLNWRQILRREIVQHIKNDYTWQKPHTSYYSTDIYIPSTKDADMVNAVIAIDTSGSISNEELRQFISEIKGIMKEYEHVNLTLMDCDCKVYNVWDIKDMDELNSAIKGIRGGGGTSFIPIFERIDKDQLNPKVVVIFTDGYGDYPDKIPSYQVIWILTKVSQTPPFGTIIKME